MISASMPPYGAISVLKPTSLMADIAAVAAQIRELRASVRCLMAVLSMLGWSS
ncbi:hypothetical protein ABIE67_000139 [Streptomyces sp. V4I8]|uniref:hypothetical protein n=1 Tax=Streptomyces sp. V4I8 TaxID=3156469 RepID=UPI0035157FA7